MIEAEDPQKIEGPEPEAAYPRPFSRPPSMGGEYDTWQDANGPDIGEVKVDIRRLPPRVDNSLRPEFPPIYQQHGGACGQFTAIASIFTYEMNVLEGTHADEDSRRFPADFSWNMINQADARNGSEAYHGWETAKHLGIPSVATYGTVHRKEAGPWPDGYAIWREAMQYRVAGYRYTPAQSIKQIHEARGWLFDRNQPSSDGKSVGGLFALDGRMGELEKVTHKIAAGQPHAGEDLWIRWGPSGYGHGITCVGYDDDVGFDVNGDGKITCDEDINGDRRIDLADWERGAFIVVNSWGEKWSDDGKIYLLYSAMVDPTWERGNYLGRVEVCRHVPRRTLRVKLSCSDRSSLRVAIGTARDKGAKKAEHEFRPEFLNAWPLFGKGSHVGKVPLGGPGDNHAIEVGVDLTPLLHLMGPDEDGEGRLFLRFSTRDRSKAEGEVHEIAIRSYDAQGSFIEEAIIVDYESDFGSRALMLESNFSIPETQVEKP